MGAIHQNGIPILKGPGVAALDRGCCCDDGPFNPYCGSVEALEGCMDEELPLRRSRMLVSIPTLASMSVPPCNTDALCLDVGNNDYILTYVGATNVWPTPGCLWALELSFARCGIDTILLEVLYSGLRGETVVNLSMQGPVIGLNNVYVIRWGTTIFSPHPPIFCSRYFNAFPLAAGFKGPWGYVPQCIHAGSIPDASPALVTSLGPVP